jgi:hypothetical protein
VNINSTPNHLAIARPATPRAPNARTRRQHEREEDRGVDRAAQPVAPARLDPGEGRAERRGEEERDGRHLERERDGKALLRLHRGDGITRVFDRSAIIGTASIRATKGTAPS